MRQLYRGVREGGPLIGRQGLVADLNERRQGFAMAPQALFETGQPGFGRAVFSYNFV